jgi:hypothetical protein
MNLGRTSNSLLHFALLIPFLPEVCSAAPDGFMNFKTGPVWLLVLAPDGRHLYAPDTAVDRRGDSG